MKVGEKFIPIERFEGPLLDANYVEGAIEIMIDRTTVSSLRYWDYVDQLWSYIIDGVEKIRHGEVFETRWPDQPIKLIIRPVPGEKLRVERSNTSDADISIVVDKFELIDALLVGAVTFFDVFSRFDDRWTRGGIHRKVLDELCAWRDVRHGR